MQLNVIHILLLSRRVAAFLDQLKSFSRGIARRVGVLYGQLRIRLVSRSSPSLSHVVVNGRHVDCKNLSAELCCLRRQL